MRNGRYDSLENRQNKAIWRRAAKLQPQYLTLTLRDIYKLLKKAEL